MQLANRPRCLQIIRRKLIEVNATLGGGVNQADTERSFIAGIRCASNSPSLSNTIQPLLLEPLPMATPNPKRRFVS